jgi:hypothetical protein
MTESKPKLLVALSDGFALPRLFAARMDNLVRELGDFEVALVQDRRGIAFKYFEANGVSPREARSGSRQYARRLVDASTHVVVFWGGDDLADIVYFATFFRKKYRIVPVRLTTVKNKDRLEEYDVYIGRGSPWGNPFPIKHGPGGDTREDVIRKFRAYFEDEILSNPEKKSQLLSLRGYRLGCHCKPEACHGDVIAEFLNSYEDDEDAGEVGE